VPVEEPSTASQADERSKAAFENPLLWIMLECGEHPCAAIVERTGATWPVSLILVALGILTVIAVLSTRETAARPMRS
jgi:hypothetical protein